MNRKTAVSAMPASGQTLDAQLEQLRGAGCTKIYREKVTGAHNDRRELFKMLAALAPGDVLTVTRIDRLSAAPSTCSPSSSRSLTPRRNSARLRSRRPIPPRAAAEHRSAGIWADPRNSPTRRKWTTANAAPKVRRSRNSHRPMMSDWRRFLG
jgi:hypothetical protein